MFDDEVVGGGLLQRGARCKQAAPPTPRDERTHLFRPPTPARRLEQRPSPLPHGTENHLEGIALAPLQRLLPCLLSTSSPRLVRHRHRLPQTSRNARWPRQVYRRLKNRARVLTCDHPASLAERLPRFVLHGAAAHSSRVVWALLEHDPQKTPKRLWTEHASRSASPEASPSRALAWMPSAPLAERVTACVVIIAVSAILLYVISFAHSTTLHNAAHDVRHAFAFPCH